MFDAVDQLSKVLDRILLLLDQRGNRPKIGILEILADDTAKRAAGKLLFGHHRIILIGASEGLVTDLALGFESADHRRERIEMGFRLGGQRDQFPHEQRAVFPETAHQFLFPACQFFHSVGSF